jgi:hypothetical protein
MPSSARIEGDADNRTEATTNAKHLNDRKSIHTSHESINANNELYQHARIIGKDAGHTGL